MSIPATNPVTEQATYDKLLMLSLRTGPNCIYVTLDKFGASGTMGMPVEHAIARAFADTADKAFCDAVDAMAAAFAELHCQTTPVDPLKVAVAIYGAATDAGVVSGSMEAFLPDGSTVQVPDVYATAAADGNFAVILGTFMAALATLNQAKGIV